MTGGTATGRAGRTALVPALPDALRLEVAAVGDLRCAMCLQRCRPPVNRLTAAMSLSTFRCLVDDVPGLRELTLQGMGEPLLAPNLVDMVRYAKGRGIRVAVETNATLLYRDRAEELVDAGLDRLHVSLDGADPQGFDAVPERAHFGPVLENLAGLVAARRAAGSGEPGVHVVFVATAQNIAQLPDLVALLGGIGVGEVRVQPLSPQAERLDPDRVLAREPLSGEPLSGEPPADGQPTVTPGEVDPRLAARLFAEAGLAAEEYGLDLRLPDPAATGLPAPGDTAYVTSDGALRACCLAVPDDTAAPERLGDRTFADLWVDHADRLAARRG
jgi:MoaA/NifB/PqqE/SkfB family radical SAM enzyme